MTVREVAGPWSLATSRAFWEGFTPAAPHHQPDDPTLRTVFLVAMTLYDGDGPGQFTSSGLVGQDASRCLPSTPAPRSPQLR